MTIGCAPYQYTPQWKPVRTTVEGRLMIAQRLPKVMNERRTIGRGRNLQMRIAAATSGQGVTACCRIMAEMLLKKPIWNNMPYRPQRARCNIVPIVAATTANASLLAII